MHVFSSSIMNTNLEEYLTTVSSHVTANANIHNNIYLFTLPSYLYIHWQPRTQGLTYGKDPGWGWSRDFTKIDWLRVEGRVSNCMLPQKSSTKNVTLQLQGVDQSDLNYISSFLRYMVRNAC
jgi:hypothetical protein